MARGYHGPPDPEKGRPYRHVRAQVQLLMEDMAGDAAALEQVIWELADKRPLDVLDAMIAVHEDSEKGEEA